MTDILIHNFENNWSVGSVSDHSIAKGLATITTGLTGATSSLRNRPFANGKSLNLKDRFLKIRFKVDGMVNMTSLQMDVGDGTLANRYRVELLNNDQGVQWVRDGEWVEMTVTLADAVVTGAPDVENLTGMQFRLTAENGVDCSLSVEWVKTFKKGETVVTFSADDGYPSVYTEFYPLLKEHGFVGSIYFPYQYLNDRLSLVQLQEMYSNGFEIGGHGVGSNDPDLSASEYLKYIEAQEIMGMAHFEKNVTFAYPGGNFNDVDGLNPVDVLKNNAFTGARTISQVTTETSPPADNYRLRVEYLTNQKTVASVTERIDRVIEFGGTLHIAGVHDLVESNADQTTKYLVDDFRQIVEHVAFRGCTVKTVGETLSK